MSALVIGLPNATRWRQPLQLWAATTSGHGVLRLTSISVILTVNPPCASEIGAAWGKYLVPAKRVHCRMCPFGDTAGAVPGSNGTLIYKRPILRACAVCTRGARSGIGHPGDPDAGLQSLGRSVPAVDWRRGVAAARGDAAQAGAREDRKKLGQAVRRALAIAACAGSFNARPGPFARKMGRQRSSQDSGLTLRGAGWPQTRCAAANPSQLTGTGQSRAGRSNVGIRFVIGGVHGYGVRVRTWP